MKTTDRTLEALGRALDADPGDSVARLALADYYEESGAAGWRAEFQRALVGAGKYPDGYSLHRQPGWWYWWYLCDSDKWPAHSQLPGRTMGLMCRQTDRLWPIYQTRAEAEDALFGVWKQGARLQ